MSEASPGSMSEKLRSERSDASVRTSPETSCLRALVFIVMSFFPQYSICPVEVLFQYPHGLAISLKMQALSELNGSIHFPVRSSDYRDWIRIVPRPVPDLLVFERDVSL